MNVKFPHPKIQEKVTQFKVDRGANVYLMGVLKYLTFTLLEAAAKETHRRKRLSSEPYSVRRLISAKDIKNTLKRNKKLAKFLREVHLEGWELVADCSGYFDL